MRLRVEGKPVGTILCLGIPTRSMPIRQLIINPSVVTAKPSVTSWTPLVETIKEFAAIDGAFIITGDGIVLSGSYLRPQITEELPALPGGYGARHAAAAGISACTNALRLLYPNLPVQ